MGRCWIESEAPPDVAGGGAADTAEGWEGLVGGYNDGVGAGSFGVYTLTGGLDAGLMATAGYPGKVLDLARVVEEVAHVEESLPGRAEAVHSVAGGLARGGYGGQARKYLLFGVQGSEQAEALYLPEPGGNVRAWPVAFGVAVPVGATEDVAGVGEAG